MSNYPSYWICKCGHEMAKHRSINGACLVRTDGRVFADEYVKYGIDWGGNYQDNCGSFSPVDNLTMVERVAEKGFI